MKKTEGKSTMDSAKVTSFEDFESFYAVEVVREARNRHRNGSVHGELPWRH